ncbi:MAG: S9 family peptidase [Chloroflexota bacterium]|nr:S9 family peptidase [Chloroflexota bacterium]
MTDLDAILNLPRLDSLRLSPDGERLVASVARPAPDGKKMHAAIWALDPSGEGAPRRLTRSAPGESVGAFMRDGSLLFTSARPDPDRPKDEEDDGEETGRLWLLPASGGEARVLVTPSGGVEDVRAAREADVIIFTASVHPGVTSLAGDRDRQKSRTKAGVEALLLEGYPIRRWDHYLGPRERHLFAATLPPGEDRLAEPVDLTPEAGHALLETGYDVTPDGATIVTSWSVTAELTRLQERLVAIDRSSGAHRFLTPDDESWYSEPACSPDGRWVVATRSGPGSPGRIGDQTLWLVDLESGDGRDLTPDLDLWPHGPAWSPDSQAVLFTADRRGHAAVLHVELSSGAVTVLAAEGAFTDLAPTPDGQGLFALRSSYAGPPAVVRLAASGAEQRAVPVRSFPELDGELPGTLERLRATASDGVEVASWLVLPRDASVEAPAPLVVWVHGGPLSSWNAWSWRWNPHLLAAAGYAILLPDPALSTGYGLEYLQRGWGRWGEEPYTDVMAAVDAALERPDLDKDRTGLMGGSFGGYMANWVAGNTDRFRAIVTHASLWELRGFHGTTDFGPEWEREFGDPYADPSRYEASSPHRLVDRIRTPMLVVHGEKDHRVPISEALRLWTDLSRHGVASKFLYFPDENHWVLKPQNARVWYETVTAFLDHHVRGQEWRRPPLL